MPEKFSRRQFIGWAAALSLPSARAAYPADDGPVLAVADTPDPAGSVRSAINALGGIYRFVGPGRSVMLLPNPQGRLRGASTRPELVGEMVKLCLAAGAAGVEVCSIHEAGRWQGTGIDDAARRAGAEVWTPGNEDWVELEVKGGRCQQRVTVVAPAVRRDVLINMPIAKHHGSTRFTGALKNLMGLNNGNTGWHAGTDHLAGSIVDLASVVRPQLCLMDATEMLAENGPFGPGKVVRANKVIAAVDPVAADSYACSLLGMKAEEVSTIRQACERGLGRIRLEKTSSLEGGRVELYRGVG
ncbi:MAG: DUF362 domain-containing protein [Candidatus Glassbacteria bacterium]|nr:DUF362 domain-containing protein [Candidatus Glassbacteria bacterium]